jgi:hypothetical protein
VKHGVTPGPAVAPMAALMPWAMANALVTAASTLLCAELRARFTFQAGRPARWRGHRRSAGSDAAAYVMTCAATLLPHLPSAGMPSEQAVRLGAGQLCLSASAEFSSSSPSRIPAVARP